MLPARWSGQLCCQCRNSSFSAFSSLFYPFPPFPEVLSISRISSSLANLSHCLITLTVSFFLMFQSDSLRVNLCPSLLSFHGEPPRRVQLQLLCTLPSIEQIPLSLFSRPNSSTILSLSSQKRCSSLFIIFMALCQPSPSMPSTHALGTPALGTPLGLTSTEQRGTNTSLK